VDNTWFETPAPALLTPDVIATLQRALEARGFWRAISSQLDDDAAAHAGVIKWSTAGPDSPVPGAGDSAVLGGGIACNIPASTERPKAKKPDSA